MLLSKCKDCGIELYGEIVYNICPPCEEVKQNYGRIGRHFSRRFLS